MSKKNNWDINGTFLDVVTKGASIVLIIVSIVVSVISPFLLNLFKDKILILSEQNLFILTGLSAAITLIFAIVLYCIGSIKRFRDIILRSNLTDLNELINQLKISSENIANNVNHVENLIMESYIIHDISKFYNKLIELRENVKDNRSIRLMNFASYPIQENNKHRDDNDSVQKYFGNELLFCENKPDASVYKIVSIHNEEKLDECKKLVNRAGKMNLRNFHLAFLNIKNSVIIFPT